MTAKRIMIDLETLGTAVNAKILSIGAVTSLGGRLHQHIHPSEQPMASISAATALWWMEQSQEARMGIVNGVKTGTTLRDALLQLSNYISSETEVWCKGPTFDVAILEQAYKDAGLPVPWAYNKVRDYRTLVKAVPWIKPLNNPLAHDALSDAIYQMEHLEMILNELSKISTAS